MYRSFIPKQGICALVVEFPDDLWTLRRLISPGDTVVTKSSRVSKREDEFSRPDRGERVKVTIASGRGGCPSTAASAGSGSGAG